MRLGKAAELVAVVCKKMIKWCVFVRVLLHMCVCVCVCVTSKKQKAFYLHVRLTAVIVYQATAAAGSLSATHSKASANNLRPHTQRHLGPHTQRHLPTTLDHTLKGICQQPWTTHSRASVNNLGPLTADPPTCNAGTGGCWLMCSEIHIYEAETIEQMHALTWPLHVKCGHRWVVADLLHEHVRAI